MDTSEPVPPCQAPSIGFGDSQVFFLDTDPTNLVPVVVSRIGRGSVTVRPPYTNYVSGYVVGETVDLIATPARWYAFVQWSDGVTNNPRQVTIGLTNDYLAIFTNTVPLEWWTPKYWERTFGASDEDFLNSLIELREGGLLLGGASSSRPSGTKTSANYWGYDYWVIRLDPDGQQLWERSLPGNLHDWLTCLLEVREGGFLLGGSTGEGGIYDAEAWLVKMAPSGTQVWQRLFGGSGGNESIGSLVQTRDGGFLLGASTPIGVSGTKTSPSFGGWDWWIIKVDEAGQEQWQRSFGGSGHDYLNCLVETRDGGYLLGGTSGSGVSGNKTSPTYGSDDFWVIKLDGEGNKQWERSFGGSGSDSLARLVQTRDGGFLLGGSSYSGVTGTKTSTNYGASDFWVVKIDANGNKLWEQTVGGSFSDDLSGLVEAGDGGLLLGGTSVSAASGNKTTDNYGNADYWLVRLDANGKKLGDRSFGGGYLDSLSALAETRDGGIVLGGNSGSDISGVKTTPNYGLNDYWVLKLWSYEAPVGTPQIYVNGQFANAQSNLVFASTNTINVTLQTSFTNGVILYTLDGSDPISFGTVYTGLFAVTNDAVLRAVAFSWDYSASAEAEPVAITIVPVYTLVIGVTGNGAIQISGLSDQLNVEGALATYLDRLSNAVVTLTVTPADGWGFAGWSGDTDGQGWTNYRDGASFLLTGPMDRNRAVEISFYEIPIYTLNVSTPGGGLVQMTEAGSPTSVVSGQYVSRQFPSNTLIEITATNNLGWSFMGWSGGLTSTQSTVLFPLTSDLSAVAVFGTALNTSVTGSGTVAKDPPTGPYPYGSTVRLTALPAAGNYLRNWGGAAAGRTNSPLDFVVTNINQTVGAIFAAVSGNNFALVLQVSGEGSVSYTPTKNLFASNQTVTITASPKPGHAFMGWSGALNGANPLTNPLTVTMTSNRTIAANFELGIPPRIALQPLGRTNLVGSSVTFTVVATGVPAPEFRWYQDGVLLPGVHTAELTLSNVTLAAAGRYVCVVTNSYGSATSVIATLTVDGVLPPAGMALIPAGVFTMGDNFGIGNPDERPVHEVYVSTFLVDKFEVTKALWDEVFVWGTNHGYQFAGSGLGAGGDHPVCAVYWFDAVKWCNARSEKEGRTPAYYTDTTQTNVYRTGQTELTAATVLWNGNGYRLPTEAEWEKAARGGLAGQFFPWAGTNGTYADNINGNKANFLNSGDPYEGNSVKTTPVGFYNDMANGYGLYDMAGNVCEWCWDVYDEGWYTNAVAIQDDTRGPTNISVRVIRGGAWNNTTYYMRCALRNAETPFAAFIGIGFRCVIGQTTASGNAPQITLQPQSQTNAVGASVSLSVAATGVVPLNFSWQKSVESGPWTAVTDATNSSLIFPALALADAGEYRCVITNLYGATTSAVATLTVTNLPVNLLPLVAMVQPTNHAVFTLSAPQTNLQITVNASDTDGAIAQVQVFAGTNRLGTLTNAPYTLVWSNVPVGIYTLFAVAYDNLGSNAVSAPVTINVLLPGGPAEFRLQQALYQVGETASQVVVRVLKTTGGAGAINFATRDGTAKAVNHEGYGDYQSVSGSLVFAPLDTEKTLTIPIVNDLGAEGDQDFYLELSLTGDGSTLGAPATATIRIIDDEPPPGVGSALEVRTPTNWPALGKVRLRLEPANAEARWRFRWETEWRASDTEAVGLEPGEYTVDFKAVSGSIAPAPDTFVLAAGATVLRTNYYIVSGQPVTGSLLVTLQPLGGRWRFQGQTTWYNSGTVAANVAEGERILEFEPVSGRITPAPARVMVTGGQVASVSVYYPPQMDWGVSTPAEPGVVNIASLQAQQNPYACLGQLWTEAGYSSGYVVKERVVLTAAHAVFNEASLSFVAEALWFFQRHKAEHEPLPQAARGWYVFSGYAAARSNSPPGQSSVDAYNLDVAAVYFLQAAGRNGFGGYLVSDTTRNWLTGPENKLLAGYPVSGKDGLIPGKLYTTAEAPFSFDPVQGGVYSSANFRSYPGNSGGPLCVRHTNNLCYPAGVYLGESGPKSIVRIIDTNVVDLLNRAELSANTGDNNTGGGVVLLQPGIGGGLFTPGYLQVVLGPPAALEAGAGWRLVGHPLPTYYSDNDMLYGLLAGGYTVEFKTIAGFAAPSNRPVQILAGQTAVIQGNYVLLAPGFAAPARGSNGVFGFSLSGQPGTVYLLEASTNLGQTNWTILATNTMGANGIWNFSDSASTNLPARYYRAKEQ